MVGNVFFEYDFLSVLVRKLQERTFETYFFESSLCHHLAGGHVEELILDRTAAAIQH